MMSSRATAIELDVQHTERATHRATSTVPAVIGDDDPILAASRLADSTVPDGGRGWIVVLGCAIVGWWFVGTSYSWGVIQGALVEEGLSSPAILSFVGSLSAALISALAVVNGRVVRAVGSQWTAVIGVTLLGFSEILSSFAVGNVAGLFFTSGVVLGLGMSLCFIVCLQDTSTNV